MTPHLYENKVEVLDHSSSALSTLQACQRRRERGSAWRVAAAPQPAASDSYLNLDAKQLVATVRG